MVELPPGRAILGSPRHLHLIKKACKIAKKSKHPKYQVGCIIGHKGKIISKGVNLTKTHPLAKITITQLVHAELNAIIAANNSKLNKCIAYVARIKKNNNLGMARPCPCCMMNLYKVGIRKVIYTTEYGGYCMEQLPNSRKSSQEARKIYNKQKTSKKIG